MRSPRVLSSSSSVLSVSYSFRSISVCAYLRCICLALRNPCVAVFPYRPSKRWQISYSLKMFHLDGMKPCTCVEKDAQRIGEEMRHVGVLEDLVTRKETMESSVIVTFSELMKVE